MELLAKKGNNLNPDVLFDPETGNLSIRGKSIPMGVDSFLTEVMGWLEKYSENPKDHTEFEIDLKYLNGQSIRTLLSILTKLKAINDTGKQVTVNWSMPKEADDLHDLSEDVLNGLNLPHHIRYN